MGSSRMTSFEFHMTAFATATACRWPPDRPATAWRTERSVVTDRLSSVSREARSMLDSSRTTRCGPLAPEEHVGDDVEVVGEREVLVHDLDPEPGGVARAVDVDALALEAHLAFVERVDADDALDQRRLAGAVVADEGHDLAAADLEVDPVERLDGAERLRDALALEERRVSHRPPLGRGGGDARGVPSRPALAGQPFSWQKSVCATSPVQISSIVRNSSAMTVSAMLSTVTAMGTRAM